MGERQKAKYRLIVCALLAVLGPPAFGLSSVHAVPYSLLLVLYALWTVHLAATFAGDRALGFLLCLFDAALLVPLPVWGDRAWLAVPMGLLWAGGLWASVRCVHCAPATARAEPPGGRDRGRTGVAVGSEGEGSSPFGARCELVETLRARRCEAEGRGAPCAILVVRLQRYGELVAVSDVEGATRALITLVRRVRWVVEEARTPGAPAGNGEDWGGGNRGPGKDRAPGGRPLGYRVADDRIVVLIPADVPDLETLAGAARRYATARLVQGRKLEASVGYAYFPADGVTLAELLAAADESAVHGVCRVEPAVGRSRLAVGS